MNEEMLELLRNINRNLEVLAKPYKLERKRALEAKQLREIMRKRDETVARHRRQVRGILAARNTQRVPAFDLQFYPPDSVKEIEALPSNDIGSFNRLATSIKEWGG